MAKVKDNAFVLAVSVVLATLVAFAVTFFYPDNVAQADAPVLESISITSTPARSDDTYYWGENVEISLVFNKNVSVGELSSGPNIYLDNGDTHHSLYNRGNGTNTLVYHYYVGMSHWDGSGLAVLATTNFAVTDATIGGETYYISTPGLHGQTSHKVDGSVGAPDR